MSAEHDDGSSLISIGLGVLASTAAGAVLGMISALSTWPPAPDSSSSLLFAGLCVGGVMGLMIGWFLSWHASVVGILPDRPGTTMLWGIIPALLLGAVLGPVFAGITSLFFGQLASALIFGLLFGPLVGVLGWELSFFAVNFLSRSEPQSHSH